MTAGSPPILNPRTSLLLRDLLVVITGGGRGIGRAIAQRLHGHGARIVVMGRTEADLVARCTDLPGSEYRVVDVTDEASVAAAFASLAAVPDVLVNNAGGADSAPFSKLSPAAWHDTIALNLHGVFYCCHAVVAGMVARGRGRIINIASTSALEGYPYVVDYCAAKHGVLGLTRALAAELRSSGVTANAVCPGFTDTGLLERSVTRIVATTGRTEAEARDALSRANPEGRILQPGEVAATVAWLLSEDAEAVTGEAVLVDGKHAL